MADISHHTALIVGNADIPMPEGIRLDSYNYIAVFNLCRKPELYARATHHFLRMGKERQYSGAADIGKSAGRICVVDNGHTGHGREILESCKAAGRATREIGSTETRPRGYPSGKSPSTGLIAVEYFRSFRIKPDVCCFTWEGVPAHDWEWEREYLKKLSCDGEVRIIGESTEARKLCHFVWIDADADGKSRDLNPPEFFSIDTFRSHHKTWEIILWTNADFSGTLFDECVRKGLTVRKMSLSDIPFKAVHAVQYADYWRYKALFDEGGMYCDLADTVTIRPMDDLLNQASVLTRAMQSRGANICSGWFCVAQKGSTMCGKVLDAVKAGRMPLARRADFESFLAANGVQQLSRCLSHKYVYPIHFSDINSLLNNRLPPLIFQETRQIHFYASVNTPSYDYFCKGRRDSMDADAADWRKAKGLYAQALRFAYGVSEPAEAVQLAPIPIKSMSANLSDYTKHAIVMSLGRTPERLSAYREREKAAGLSPALHLDSFTPVIGLPQKNGTLTERPGATGCALSMMASIKMAKALGWPYVIVYEDDVTFCNDYPSKVNRLVKSCPDNWDVISLGHLFPRDKIADVAPGAMTAKGQIGAQSMLIHARGYDKVMSGFNRWELPGDMVYDDGYIQGLIMYRADPTLTGQLQGLVSTIDNKVYAGGRRPLAR